MVSVAGAAGGIPVLVSGSAEVYGNPDQGDLPLREDAPLRADHPYGRSKVAQERAARIAEIDAQFADLELGFVDSAIVALAESLGVRRIATTDRRHFDPLARAFGFALFPAPPGGAS